MDPVARRYAQALAQEAQSQGVLEDVDVDVDLLHATLEGSRDLRLVLESPIYSQEKTRAVLEGVFGSKVSALTSKFLNLLVQKERDGQIPSVLEAYRQLRDDRLGVIEASVKTAKPLAPEQMTELQKSLEARAGKTVRMRYEIDPSLVGGLVVRLGDVVFDRSVKHQLEMLRDQFAERAQISLN
ncbi:ATP synthase F1 subunit delta [Rubrivirga sp.]|uniref:ATP synthase F1 subunit delta n=1 Tax=Rubrivirga sp. TaxID=1885344 RepID=UPI003C7191D0